VRQRPNGLDRVAGRLVQVEVEVGQGDHGVPVVLEESRERFAHIASDDQGGPDMDMAEVLALLVCVQHLAQMAGVALGERKPARDGAGTGRVDVCYLGKAGELSSRGTSDLRFSPRHLATS
jgi:hypothetical protein